MKNVRKKSCPEANTLNTLKTGRILVDTGLVSLKDVHQALSIQEQGKKTFSTQSYSNEPGRLLGTILCDLNLITPVDLYFVLHENNKIYTMENLLVNTGKLSRAKTDMLITEQKCGFYSFFDLILKYNILSVSHLQQQIFELYRIPYRHVNNFAYAKNDKNELAILLDKKTSYKKLAIPMIKKNYSFIMGITDPETLIFVYDLNFKLPNYRIVPVFIPLQHFKELYEKLYNISFPGFYSSPYTPNFSHDVKSHVGSVAASVTAPPTFKKESLFFFKHKITISDPEREKHLILDLYSKYEILRQLTGENVRTNQFPFFMSFIGKQFELLVQSSNCTRLEIILYGDHNRVNLIAEPIDG